MAKNIKKRADDYAQWYLDVIKAAQLADYAPVRGCMVIRPEGYAIWEAIQRQLDRRFKETGHVNAYFPLLIPQSFLAKEAQHVEGFAMECAVVTHTQAGEGAEEGPAARRAAGGAADHPAHQRNDDRAHVRAVGAELSRPADADQPVVQRDALGDAHAAVPAHQPNSSGRRGTPPTRPPRRRSEETLRMLDVYADFAENVLAIPVIKGAKTESEKFPGAVTTYCIEALMQDGKALQMRHQPRPGAEFRQGVRHQVPGPRPEAAASPARRAGA